MLSPTEPASRWRLPTIEIPSPLRALVRARESSILLLGAAIGAVAGLIVAVMGGLVSLMHVWLFALPLGQRLSAATSLDPGARSVFHSWAGSSSELGSLRSPAGVRRARSTPSRRTRSMAGA